MKTTLNTSGARRGRVIGPAATVNATFNLRGLLTTEQETRLRGRNTTNIKTPREALVL